MAFHNKLVFYGEGILAPRPTSSWRTTPCHLSAAAYSIYSQQLSNARIGWYGLDWSGSGYIESSCQRGNELSGSIKC
jgi:hypothetical protein